MKLSNASFLVIAAFGAIYFIWGSTYLALALALQSLPPFLLMAARCLVGGLILFVGAAASGAKAPSRKSLLYGIVCGLLFFVGCHGILANVQQRVPTGLAAIMLATIPLWIAALQTGLRRPNRPSALSLTFLAPGVLGVALIAWEEVAGGIEKVHLIDIFLLLGASLSWSIGTVVSEQSPTSSSPLVMSIVELWAGAAALAIVGAADGEASLVHPSSITAWSIAGWAYLTIAGTVIAFASYIWLLRKVTPTLVATYTFVNPIIAVMLGWAILGEVPSMWMASGALLVILSVSGLLFTSSARRSKQPNNAGAEFAVD
ncbi:MULTISPECIES: EamA family transporter [unclassified Mesorhizobium]|uniref:EamA family transporter n=1 Tax=unclassified Mesorhizobium TaxID=325217 RepID=UPI001127C4BE|nr:MULTISPECIES: EamA family transporter [unclassified Mesorhizobium]MBZ9973960.1 EamA family transporter [Mesorhizobium sp. BR-1-1-10]TPK10508.1 EamA family transporter [Mesorhizobium sp. B2-5-7]